MAETKVTRKDMFNFAIKVFGETEWTNADEKAMAKATTEMFEKYIAQLSKKAKPRVNEAAIEFAAACKGVMTEADNETWTAKALAAAMTEATGEDVSSHKASAALRRLHQEGFVTLAEKEHKSDPNTYTVAR